MIHTITNLYPYPKNPTRGVFNLQLFTELSKLTDVHNNVLVANLNPLKSAQIKKWVAPKNSLKSNYIPYQHIPIIGRNLSWRFIAYALKAQISEAGLQILASWLYPDGAAVAHAFRNREIPVWIMVLGTDRFHLNNPYRKKVILNADKHTAGYICVSRNIANDLISAGIPAAKVHLIRNGVDTSQFYPIHREEARLRLPGGGGRETSMSRRKLAKADDQKTNGHRPRTKNSFVIWIGNLEPIKAPDVALKAFAIYIQNCKSKVTTECSGEVQPKATQLGGQVVPRQTATGGRSIRRASHGVPEGHEGGMQSRDYTSREQQTEVAELPSLVFIGDGSMLSYLEKISQKLKIEDCVHFIGRRPHKEIPFWLNTADGLILSSHSEGMPNAISEALACGCPVVTTDVGACAEMLESQPCCNVVPPNNPKAMATALKVTLDQAKQTKKRPTFTRTWANMAGEVISLIRD